MKAIGIIAEYNPFHNGHLYHLNTIKKHYKDYKIVLILNGNFTERGDVSIIDKWKRTEIALKEGIDLVIELPFPFATQSADYFSYGAITLLEYLNVEKVVFGSESDNIEDLKLIAKTQLDNEEFDKLVKIYSKFGYNYPTALSLALEDLTGKKITTPNDLLGISYIKTILKYNYKIEPVTIKRINNYHEKELNNTFSSATSIRESLKVNKNIKGYVPDLVLPYLEDLHMIDDYFNILKYKIITSKNLEEYQTVDEGFDKLLKKNILEVNNIDELIKKIKSKRYTYNKISRMLIHILCNFTKEHAKSFNKISYIRILGFNNSGREYLSTIKKDTQVPIISKIAKNMDKMLEFEIETTKVYDIINNKNLAKKELQKIIIMEEKIMDKKMLKQKKTGQIIVISAPSGAGKGTVIGKLLERDNKSRWLSVSATSRKPREGEKEGVNYYYLTEDDFKEKIDDNFFLEYTNYAGNYYGTPKKYIKEKIDQGIDVILEIEIEGATSIKKLIPEAIFIFIMPPSLKTLVKRLKKRGTESNDKIIKRFHEAYKEINEVTKYNYVVVNDEIDDTVDKIEAILKAEKCRVDRIEEVYLDTKEEEIHELLMEDEEVFVNTGLGDKLQ